MAGESPDLDNAETALEDAKYNYQKALLNTTDNTSISDAQYTLDSAKQDKADYIAEMSNDSELTKLKLALADAEIDLADAITELDTAKAKLLAIDANAETIDDELAAANELLTDLKRQSEDYTYEIKIRYDSESGPTDPTKGTAYEGYTAAQLNDLLDDKEAERKIQYDLYTTMVARAQSKISVGDSDAASYWESALAAGEKYQSMLDTIDKLYDIYLKKLTYNNTMSTYNTLVGKKNDVDREVTLQTRVVEDWTTRQAKVKPAQETVDAAEKEVETLTTAVETAQKNIDTYNDTYTKKIKELDTAIKSAERALEKVIAGLESSEASTNLELEKLRKAVKKAQENYDELVAEGETTEITAEVAGIVKSVNVTPGKEFNPITSTTAMTIEMPERGYYLTFSVTTEQAAQLRAGMTGAVSG